MIFLYAVGLGILLGYALRGRLAHLARVDVRALWLVLGALVIQLLIFPLFAAKPIIAFGTAPLHALSYSLVLLWLVLNVRIRPLLAIGAGALSNALVVLANGGYMPASAQALRVAGLEATADVVSRGESYGNIIAMSSTSRLNALGDWIPLPHELPFATAMSLGDALVMIGLVWLLAKGMTTRGPGA
jgi:hypothetical protein